MAIAAEGFTPEELPMFRLQAASLAEKLLSTEPFASFRDRLNIVIVSSPSDSSGISNSHAGALKHSAFGASYDHEGLARFVTIPDMAVLADRMTGIPWGYLFIMMNTEKYGGSGPYNAYSIFQGFGDWHHEVAIHEFGHTFANLGDEYEADGYDDYYDSKVEPDEPNITTLANFKGKWQNLIDEGKASLIEGAGYSHKGVWRGCEKCIMRSLGDYEFCEVCRQAISRTILFLTEENQ